MLKTLLKVLRAKDVRKKILFTFALLIVYRVLAHIPVPGVDPTRLADFVSNNQFVGLLDIFSGGGLSSLSIVMLGTGPYITASIIIQLMTQIIPKLNELQKEAGEEGRRKINQYTRILAVPLAVIQGYATILIFTRGSASTGGQPLNILENLNPVLIAEILVVAVAGAVLVMWIGELISEYGVGNGISLLIFAGITARIPTQIQQTRATFDASSDFGPLIAILVIGLIVIAAIVFIQEAQRNIPIRYARQIRGAGALGGSASHLPLRVNQAGVIPIIFALSVMLFPGLIANFTANVDNQTVQNISQWVVNFFNDQNYYALVYFILVVLFTFFYTSIVFEPKSIAENVQKQGGFIPGIRPGAPTARYLSQVLYRIVPVGALFLGVVAVLPFLMRGASNIQTISIGGTSLLIAVAVVLESIQKLESQLVEHEYTPRVKRAF
ncbi:MAG: preprotein translocase subunit SecY [bacterium]|nr:preprotein translocase subunit SecY [bacterium]